MTVFFPDLIEYKQHSVINFGFIRSPHSLDCDIHESSRTRAEVSLWRWSDGQFYSYFGTWLVNYTFVIIVIIIIIIIIIITFSDINECKTGFHDCHPKAKCHNLWGSYECKCNKGWKGRGRPDVWANGRNCYGKRNTMIGIFYLLVTFGITCISLNYS